MRLLKGLKLLKGASGSFGPVEKESLGLPQPLGLALEKGPLRLPQLPVRLTPRAGLAHFKVRRFAAPRAGLARFEGFEAFEGFEGFEGFEAFEGSIRQLRASRKRKPWLATAAGFGTRKGTTSLATASISAYSQSRFGTFQGPSFPAPRAGLARFEGFEAFEGLKGLKGLRLLKGASGSSGPVEKESLGLPQPLGLAPEKGPLPLPQLPVRQL